MAEAVKVIVRCRPMNSREKELGCQEIIITDTKRCYCAIKEPSDAKNLKDFTFDGSYDKNSTTEQIYADVGFALVESVCDGYNGTIFAYGQTGCGKSFSMQGIKDPATQRGIIPRAFEHVFEAAQTAQNRKYLVRASYLEIYNEEIRDLLGKDSKQKLEMREHPNKGVYVVGLGDHRCNSTLDCERLMEKGWNNRATGSTLMNAESSRSHSIFSIIVEMSQKDDKGEEHIRAGKLNLVDLAGSERQEKTGATGDRLKEATKINLSLSALGNVISALVDGKSKHIPYRDSKLTRLLQDSLGGNTKTLMVACLSPASDNYEESLSTLRYANRAKNIKNKPKINEDPKDALLREFQQEILRLKAMLEGKPLPPEGYSGGSDRDSSAGSSGETRIIEKTVYIDNPEALEQERERMREEYEERVRTMKEMYEQERISKEELRSDLERMRSFFDSKMTKLDSDLDVASPGQLIINDVFPSEGLDSLKMPDHLGEPSRSRKGGAHARTSVDGSDREVANGEVKASTTKSAIIEQGEALKRLQELQKVMIGGEKVNDEELKKKRTAKKKYANSRMQELAEAIANNEDDTIMLKVYDDIQEELRQTRKLVEKERERRKKIERELEDLQHEFERDRNDYLSSIRDLDHQTKLMSQILNQIQPVIPRDCNYYNLDRVKSSSKFDDEKGEWKIPPLFREQVHLPPTGPLNPMPQKGQKGMGQRGAPPTSSQFDSEDDYREDAYLKKLEQKQQQNPADYFQSKRANKLLSGRPQVDESPPPRYQPNAWVASPTGQYPEDDYGKKSAKSNPLGPTRQSRKF